MKKLLLLLGCTLCILAHIGCNRMGQEGVTSDSVRPESLSENSASSSSEKTSSNPVEDSLKENDVGEQEMSEVVNDLHYLLTSPDWDNSNKLTPTDFVMWYAVMISDKNDEGYMVKYLVDDKDGFFIPQNELEQATEKYFGVPSELLRSDSVIYDEQSQTYRTPMAIGPLAETSFEISSIDDIADGRIALHINLTINGNAFKKTLTVLRNKEGFQYISFVTVY